MRNIRTIFVATLIFSLCILSGCAKNTDNQSVDNQITEEITETTEPETVYFESDALVNQLISDINDNTDFTVEDISKGNIKSKCHCHINDCYCTIINPGSADYNVEVSIEGGNNQEDTDRMIETSKVIMKVLDPSLSDETIDGVLSELLAENYLKEDVVMGDNIKITFVPFKELSSGVSTSRIDIHSYTYGVTQ